ncbi:MULTISPECIES: PaaI family thioesterase [unclassified Microbacterium]|uniref:PaaI family thioesterase n=1 Tax=unclassified Microbacterium TaxID=2609290 RepID=UPI0008929B61|nr:MULTISPECIES: PaaI family thioesterase [unclassified Microbacterium]AOX46554.1 aromatic compound degradation protein PaaI [Microbacterium sp. BH-3-3-3]MBD8219392.1 PaaI family thioesterase [Microbacterium sp. CFBP 13617]MBD8479167.1 PaaI family thioesterase [Microbacterium sp. CFBP 8794]
MTPWTIVPGALDERLGITITAQSAERVAADMPVRGNTQSLGRLHGGATAALAEAVGSWAAMIHASTLGKVCVGVDLNITHHRGVRSGSLHAVATPAHRGRRVATYDIRVTDDDDRLVATARITNMIVDAD